MDTLAAMWEEIEAMVPRDELAAAIAAMFELTPPLGSDSDSDSDEAWRRALVTRFSTVWPFLKQLLKALQSLPELMGREKVGQAEIDTELLAVSWKRLVLAAPHLEPGKVGWKAYTF